MKKHQKHTKLAKPKIGQFHSNEWSFVGAPCGEIQALVNALVETLGAKKITYIDADHKTDDDQETGLKQNLLTDKIKYFQFKKTDLNDFDQKILLNDQELVLVNGNHFEAKKQLVLVHPKKEESLKKRISQLTDVSAYLLCENVKKPFDWLLEKIGEKPIFHIQDLDGIQNLISTEVTAPSIKGLVLAGGKSLRMGEDKGQINYHGLSQVDYLIAELKSAGLQTYVSCRAEQYEDYPRITDKYEDLGPFGAITSAFQSDPNSAWLISACDLPLVNKEVFNLLLGQRDSSKYATCFYNPETDFPDPLIAIWEPKAYMRMLEFLALGYSCPRKVLINSEIKMVKLETPAILKNVNTPEEKAMFLTRI